MRESWQDVFDRFHYGIYLITVAADSGYNGMIASWVTQCSQDPPLVAAVIRRGRLSRTQMMGSGRFTINLLPRDALDLIGTFKIRDWKKKFDAVSYSLSPQGCPVLEESLGYLDCTVERTLETGDHTLFVSRISAGELLKEGATLTTNDYGSVYRGER